MRSCGFSYLAQEIIYLFSSYIAYQLNTLVCIIIVTGLLYLEGSDTREGARISSEYDKLPYLEYNTELVGTCKTKFY